MALFLSGGGVGKDSREIDLEFLKKLRNNKPVLYVPLARDPPYDSCREWIKSNFEHYDFDNFRMIESPSELKDIDLNEYSGVYIGGGNTYKLLKDLRDFGFDNKLSEFYDSGGSIYGGSAGAIIMGKDIKSAEDPIEIEIDNFEGLSKVGNFSIFCHYDSGKKEEIKKYLESKAFFVIALSEETGIIVEKNIITSVGKKNPIIFKNNREVVLKSGEKYIL